MNIFKFCFGIILVLCVTPILILLLPYLLFIRIKYRNNPSVRKTSMREYKDKHGLNVEINGKVYNLNETFIIYGDEIEKNN